MSSIEFFDILIITFFNKLYHHNMTYKDLEGKVAIVTGIGQMGDPNMWGNGAAVSKVLACENGVKVFGCDLYLEPAEHTKKRIEAEGGVCDVMAADGMF